MKNCTKSENLKPLEEINSIKTEKIQTKNSAFMDDASLPIKFRCAGICSAQDLLNNERQEIFEN